MARRRKIKSKWSRSTRKVSGVKRLPKRKLGRGQPVPRRTPTKSSDRKRKISFPFSNYWINAVKWGRTLKQPKLVYSTYGNVDNSARVVHEVRQSIRKEIKAKKRPVLIGAVRVKHELFKKGKRVGEFYSTIKLRYDEDLTFEEMFQESFNRYIKNLTDFKMVESPKFKDRTSEFGQWDNVIVTATGFDFSLETTSRNPVYKGRPRDYAETGRRISKTKGRKAKGKKMGRVRSRGKQKKSRR